MSNVYEEQMCFEELHLHDLYFDEKKELKQKYYTFAKKKVSKITFLNIFECTVNVH